MDQAIEEKLRRTTQAHIDLAQRATQAIADRVADFGAAYNAPGFDDECGQYKILAYAGDIARLADAFTGRGWRNE